MFNLTVSEAHTFYVGQNGWLVHNASWPCNPVSTIFKGGDKYEDLLANHLEDLYPGHVQFTGLKQYRPDGTLATDWDIITRNAVIEVKSGSVQAAQILKQDALLKASGFPGKYIVYAPKIQGTVERNLINAGITVVRDLKTLEQLVKP